MARSCSQPEMDNPVEEKVLPFTPSGLFDKSAWVDQISEPGHAVTDGEDEIGALRRIGSSDVLRALEMVRRGVIYDLDPGRFPGMPLYPGHPAYQMVTYRSSRGIRVNADFPVFAPEQNPVNQGATTEITIACQHTGAHLDSLAHQSVGPDDHWYNGFSATEHLGDFGPTKADISTTPPVVTRGVLVDVPRIRGVDRLGAGEAITVDDIRRALQAQDVDIHPGDTVLFRTGIMAVWPDAARMDETDGAGINLEAAHWLVEERGAVVLGSDTSVLEQQPSAIGGVPQPVHIYLLIEQGIHIGEYFYLEELARDQVYEFACVILPLKLEGGTASMVRPVAMI